MRGESRFNLDTIAFLVVVCLLAIGAAWVLVRSSGDGQHSVKPYAVGIASRSPQASETPAPTASATVRPRIENAFRIVGGAGDSLVQVRRNGAKGVILFKGIIRPGSGRSFRGAMFWVRLGNPSRVTIVLEGRTTKRFDSVDPLDFMVRNGKLERQG